MEGVRATRDLIVFTQVAKKPATQCLLVISLIWIVAKV